ncbi:hypothetical protein EDC01DRAFT_362584 [Geopyxis carbonaria]|nr:hypothetical protein EDC01DRAFT_362584 [Geopyxis carbonaria]
MRSGTAFAFAGLYAVALQGVAATWRGESPYGVPSNIDNKCTDAESNGWDFNDLDSGEVPEYKGYGMSGWNCKSQPAKRNLEGRTFGEKCISTEAKPDGYSNEIKHDSNEFSVGHMDVSADEDTDVEFHYGMADGSTCKKVARCGKDGTTVNNDQCGGAKSVKVKLPEGSDKKKCGVNIHSVKFECGTSTVPVPTPSATTPPSDSCSPPENCGGYGQPSCELPETAARLCPPPLLLLRRPHPSMTALAQRVPLALCLPTARRPLLWRAHLLSPHLLSPHLWNRPPWNRPPWNRPLWSQLPSRSTPVESTPVESTPVESTPVESTPVESTPVESTPVEPLQWRPLPPTAPAHTAPPALSPPHARLRPPPPATAPPSSPSQSRQPTRSPPSRLLLPLTALAPRAPHARCPPPALPPPVPATSRLLPQEPASLPPVAPATSLPQSAPA